MYMLAMALGAIGYSNLTLDADGFVRRQELLSRDQDAQQSFAARLAAVVLQKEWSRAPDAGGVLHLGDQSVPLDSRGYMPIRFLGPAGHIPSVSMLQVLQSAESDDTAALTQWFAGKVVLIGSTDLGDRHSTPFYAAGGRRGSSEPQSSEYAEQRPPPPAPRNQTYGVEIQANTLATLLEGNHLREISFFLVLLLVLCGSALAALCSFQARFPAGPLLVCALVAGYFYMGVVFLRNGTIPPVVPVMAGMVLSSGVSYLAQSLTEGRQRRLLQEVFGRYVSPDVARELLDHGEFPWAARCSR